ncbi:sensor histidine kinase [Desulfonema magnum]|uniref:histidine kinase n=1 Tax=Desulfonema magnum TaxID=45655 RepID=A0A975BM61_9BACT|nr:HAMP domain-containing sensor histidine kinase [Desulfonema magnum]QTA88249.1 Histidine kinase domain-containing protein [Desulfonema magnum]
MKKTDSQNFFREVQVEFLIHELKDPISIIETGIRTLLEKKEKYGALSPRQEKTLKRTLRNTQKARGMLYDLLEVGRTEAGCFNCCGFRPENVVYDVLADVLEIMAGTISEQYKACGGKNEVIEFLADSGIFLNISPRLADAEMLQDETKFRQILGNLIKNALHFRKKWVEINMDQQNGRLIADITDDGPGVEPHHHQMIFQRYAQIKEAEDPTLQRKGHGLGLAGALILAKRLGGNIELKSKKGKGATFRLTLPITLNHI